MVHLSGTRKKATSTLSKVSKPLPTLTHTGLVFPCHHSPRERQCPTSAGCFWVRHCKNPLGSHVPQALSLALSATCPAPAGCPQWGCLHRPPCSVPSPQGPQEGMPALWEVGAPVHPLLPAFLSAGPSLCDGVGCPICRGEVTGAARRRRLSPGQQTHCIVVGVIVEERVPASLTFDCQHHILQPQAAEQRFHCQHYKPVCRAKLRSCREPWPKVQGHGRDRKTGMEHLLGLVGKCSLFCHLLQRILMSSGISSLLQKTWTSRATKREGATINQCLWGQGQMDDLPRCLGCLRKTKPPESMLGHCSGPWRHQNLPLAQASSAPEAGRCRSEGGWRAD